MASIESRLKSITYQLLKNYTPASDAELVLAARSIFDAAINADTVITEPGTMPISALGVGITWDETGKIATFELNSESITLDDLSDDVVPGLDAVATAPNTFQLGGENFELNGELFEVA